VWPPYASGWASDDAWPSAPATAQRTAMQASEVLPLFSSISASFSSFRGGRLGRSIAVVSSERELRTAVCWVLELLGCMRALPCITADVAPLVAEPVDLVLCEIELAGALLQNLRTADFGQRPAPPVVLVCQKRVDRTLLGSCLDGGAQGYVTKPLRIQAIRGIVMKHTASGPGMAVPFAEPLGEDRSPRGKHYQRVRMLGRGSFGEVFLVERKRDGMQFAMKQLSTGRLGALEQRRVLEELRLHRAFDCPCVVRYYTSWMQGDVAHLLLEYVENGSLSKEVGRCLEGGTVISDEAIVDWAGQILLGLLYLHRKEVVHRDLKCDNVLGPDDDGRVKLADFGISKRLEGSLAKSVVGTPEIMAPERCVEVLQDDEAPGYGPASDLWSLGVVVYELATLRPPFVADGEEPPTRGAEAMPGMSADKKKELLFTRIRAEEPAPLPYSRAAALHKLVGGLLRKRPQDRPTASDLCRDPALGTTIHRFLRKHHLLENPSILEVLDVLPAGVVNGGSRIESSELDVLTLHLHGSTKGLNLNASNASTCQFLDRSRLQASELGRLPKDIAAVLRDLSATSDENREAQGATPGINRPPAAVEEGECFAAEERDKDILPTAPAPMPPLQRPRSRGVSPTPPPPKVPPPLPLQHPPVWHGSGGGCEGVHPAESPSLAELPAVEKRRRRTRGDPAPVGPYHTHPQQDERLLRKGEDPRSMELEHLAVSPGHAGTCARFRAEAPWSVRAGLLGERLESPGGPLFVDAAVRHWRSSSADPLGAGVAERRSTSRRGVRRRLEPLAALQSPAKGILAEPAPVRMRQVASVTDFRAGAYETPPRGEGVRDDGVEGGSMSRSGGRRSHSVASLPSVGEVTSCSGGSGGRSAGVGGDGAIPSASSSSRARRSRPAALGPPVAPGLLSAAPAGSSRPASVPRLILQPNSEDMRSNAPSPMRSPNGQRSGGSSHAKLQEPPCRGSAAVSKSPGPSGRRSYSNTKPLASSQGTTAATRERERERVKHVAPLQEVPLVPVPLSAASLALATSGPPRSPTDQVETCFVQPPAPRSLHKCKSDCVLTRADALLSRAASAPSGELPKARGRRQCHAPPEIGGDPLTGKSSSEFVDPTIAWARQPAGPPSPL